MDDNSRDIEVQSDESNLTAEVSDEELEAAAITKTHTAMTFPSAPTVNIVFMCCGNEHPPKNLNSTVLAHSSEIERSF
jgi:hypothetical protein